MRFDLLFPQIRLIALSIAVSGRIVKAVADRDAP